MSERTKIRDDECESIEAWECDEPEIEGCAAIRFTPFVSRDTIILSSAERRVLARALDPATYAAVEAVIAAYEPLAHRLEHGPGFEWPEFVALDEAMDALKEAVR